MKFLRQRPSPAMIVATVALFVALGGAAYAGFSLPNNSVRSNHIVNGQVRNPDIRNGAVNSPKIRNGGVELVDISSAAQAALKGQKGDPGATGAPGAPGAPGATNVVMRQGSLTTVNKNSFAQGAVNCQPGERATGGGVYNEANVFFPRVVSSYPLPNPITPPPTGNGVTPTGWRVWVALNDEGGISAPASVTFHAYVICAAP